MSSVNLVGINLTKMRIHCIHVLNLFVEMAVTMENVRHLIIVLVTSVGLVWIVQPVLKNPAVNMGLATKLLSVIVIRNGSEVIAKHVSILVNQDVFFLTFWIIHYYYLKYCTRAIITRSWFETSLNYKTQILGSKIEVFPCLVHKLSVILTALQCKPQWKME